MTQERKGELYMVGSALLESWFPILSIASMHYIGALHTYAFSLIVAFVFFMILMYRKKQFGELTNKKAYRDLLWTSFWITTLFVFVFIGMRYTTAGNMAVIIFLQLFFSYLYFNVFGKEPMDKIHLVGIVLMGIGAVVVLLPDDMKLNQGDFLILIAAALSPIANHYQKRARKQSSAETILAFRTVMGFPIIALLAYVLEPSISMDSFRQALPFIVLIGTMVYVGSKILWIEALHLASITKVSAMMGLMPLFTLFFAYLYLGEIPQTRQIIGVLPIVLGGYLLTRPIYR